MISINSIEQAMVDYYGSGSILLFSILSYLYLFFRYKHLRGKILIPVALIFIVICNPILYKYIFSKIVYKRLFWMLPNTVLIATAITLFIKNCNAMWDKIFVAIIATICIMHEGTSVFEYNAFSERQNWEKIWAGTIEICDTMLELDSTPNAIVPATIFSEVRQYAPEVSMMYGRNAHWYITYIDETPLSVFRETENEVPNYEYVLSTALSLNYNFVVVVEHKAIGAEILEKYGYQEVGRSYGLIVYYNPKISD